MSRDPDSTLWLATPDQALARATIERFDPAYWTVNFPRPMMAAVTSGANRSLSLTARFYRRNDLAGLIWDSVDRFDHPLLAYDTARDYRGTTLTFRWQMSGGLPLDHVYGATLTIEGRDNDGASRAWYVRLWNYRVSGTATDAIITLPFDTLLGGFTLPAEADPVFAGDIDRLFISLVPPGYDGIAAALATPVSVTVQLTNITATGPAARIGINNVRVPPHGFSAATGYDDCYNQTPARVLRNVDRLGYAGLLDHYVGMSHFYEVAFDSGAGRYAIDPATPLNIATDAWHRDFAARALAIGVTPIVSLSFELFSENVVDGWQQRDSDGNPAATGYTPPSTLVSPTSTAAIAYLSAVAVAFVDIMVEAGHSPHFQVGEPWWWVDPAWRPHFYDATTTALYTSETGMSVPSALTDVRGTLAAPQRAYMTWLGGKLAAATAALVGAVRGAAPAVVSYALVYTPALLDGAAPDLRLANLPSGWASPAFDVMQVEDYEAVTSGNTAVTAATLALPSTLGYPPERTHYLAGFATDPASLSQWLKIETAALKARRRGMASVFIWAMPQIVAGGMTILDAASGDWRDAIIPNRNKDMPKFSADDYAGAGRALMPRGRVWPNDPASVQGRVMAAIGRGFEASDAAAIALLIDARPVAPVDLLPEWEATLGLPDPCQAAPTLAQRQAQVAARFVSGGGQSIGYYTRYAAALGVTITVREYRPFQVDVDAAGVPLWGEAWAFAWGVTITANTSGLSASVLRCELEAIKPAHTVISFVA